MPTMSRTSVARTCGTTKKNTSTARLRCTQRMPFSRRIGCWTDLLHRTVHPMLDLALCSRAAVITTPSSHAENVRGPRRLGQLHAHHEERVECRCREETEGEKAQ